MAQTEVLYMKDSYLREFGAIVTEVRNGAVILDRTAFYPNSGGQPNDLGIMKKGERVFNVVNVTKDTGAILHHLDSCEIAVGDAVSCEIDWERRYRLMRMHTAAHIIDAVLYKEASALCTGNQLGVDKSRIDFSIDVLDKEKLQLYINKANELAGRAVDVKIYFMNRDEALKIPGIVKLAAVMPPSVETLRIVEIPDIDLQADGGTQVSNTKEIGHIELIGTENRGKNNRRIYYTLG